MKKNILVFPCGSEIALEIYRSVNKSIHFNLIGASSVDDHGKFIYENYIDGVPFITDSDFIPAIKKIVQENKIDAIFPAMDAVIEVLKRNEQKLGCKVVAPGINSKMDEIRSAYGLLNLKQVDKAIENRKKVAEKYKEAFKDVEGIRYLEDIEGVKHNYSYFPIFIDEEKYGMTRDSLYAKLKDNNILGRRYFYPLISEFTTYKGLESSSKENLPVAHKLADSVICLPMYADLTYEDAERIIEVVKK